MFYLDSDTTPPIASRYLHSTTKVETAQRRAFSLLADVMEGQIGIYDNERGGEFYGYAIKHAGEAPYFEQPAADPAEPIEAEPIVTAETQARAQGWMTETEKHGVDCNRGVVHPAGWWAPCWLSAVNFQPPAQEESTNA